VIKSNPNYPITRLRNYRAFSLIEILVTMVIIVVISAFMMNYYIGGRTPGGKKVKTPMTAARESVCRINLNQCRQGFMALKSMDTDGTNQPKGMAELKFPSETTHCDVGGEAYVYDPATGEVHCPHPGHEKY